MKPIAPMKCALVVLLVLILTFVTACAPIRIPSPLKGASLPSVGSYDHLVALLQERTAEMGRNPFGLGRGLDMPMAESAASDQSRAGGDAALKGTDYSGTNVQVEGVDEADILKTDGRFLYMVHQNRVLIAQIYPAQSMKILKTLTFSEKEFYPLELYLDSKRLIVIGNTYRQIPLPQPKPEPKPEPPVPEPLPKPEPEPEPEPEPDPEPPVPEPTPEPLPEPQEPDGTSESGDVISRRSVREPAPAIWYPPYHQESTVRILVYDIENPENPEQLRDIELDGYYVSSRKIGGHLYLLSNKSIYNYAERPDEAAILPWYRDSAGKEAFEPVSYDRIRYFPDSSDTNYLMVAGLNLDDRDGELQIDAYLGAGQTVYASLENLYVTIPKWEFDQPSPDEGAPVSSDTRMLPWQPAKVSTQVYRFALRGGRAIYGAKGEVPGSLLNQFSMDEHNGHFRMATTTGDMWREDEFTSKNHLYVLDQGLSITGKIEGIAPGERIYSVRFMGDKGYMVTFKTVDPLFVLDLKDPRQPRILGELKIPGYSDYLHPYDEHHLIGFGMDAVEVDGIAYQTGMKMALFDVRDVANPKEKFSVSIGDRGTYSELLYNHKALLFSKEKDLLAFPVLLTEAKQKWTDWDRRIPNYGELAFQGLYVFGVNPETGFMLKARITHLTDQAVREAPHWGLDYQKVVTRGLYIDDTLYTVSQAYVKANRLDGFEDQGTLKLPYEDTLYR